jgi:hypothetical protein
MQRREAATEEQRARDAAKRERRRFREHAKAANFFYVVSNGDIQPEMDAARIKRIEQVDMFANHGAIELLKAFNDRFAAEFSCVSPAENGVKLGGEPQNGVESSKQQIGAENGNQQNGGESHAQKCALFEEYFRQFDAELEKERARQLEAAKAKSAADRTKEDEGASNAEWTFEQVQALIKACSIYQVGAKNRWEVIAAYVNAHCRTKHGAVVNALTAHAKAKEVLTNEKDVRALADQHRLAQLRSDLQNRNVLETHDISERYDDVASSANGTSEQNGAASASSAQPGMGKSQSSASLSDKKAGASSDKKTVWTAEEQKRLEEALRKFPGKDDTKWLAVAEHVGTHTKDECMRRYKELCEMVKAKRAGATKQT